MYDFFARFSAGELIALAAVIAGPLIAITAIITTQWRRVRVTEMELTLKQQMVERGMSAAEIEQVMGAHPHKIASTGNDALDKNALAQRMVDEGYEAADIERVIKAYQSPPADAVSAHP